MNGQDICGGSTYVCVVAAEDQATRNWGKTKKFATIYVLRVRNQCIFNIKSFILHQSEIMFSMNFKEVIIKVNRLRLIVRRL